ncbi:hypothetical protein M9H77_01427 [Catharanthus roseus]|uniref:Uncharacterized protein n=1 Tax=Catharanthus roseus TaxID=4058 RepID=A0ACC0C5Q1_CATRO|nr:hypothetical protein M9H77_01427 [Catharanthus roseus]
MFDLPQLSKCMDFLPIFCLIMLLSFSLIRMLTKRSTKVFLVDFACYKPPPNESCSKERAFELLKLQGNHNEELLDFFNTVVYKVGLSDSTYLPESLLKVPPDFSLAAARQETEAVIFGAIDKLLAKTRVPVQDIGILVVNCSLFNTVPSLSSIIVHRYKLKDTVASYSLGGMGCSSGLIAIGLADQLLKVHKNTCALIVSTENITGYYYRGNDKSKFVINCLFRLGGSAILLSNHSSHSKSSKYQLIHTVHSHTASSDQSYKSIFQEEDEQGFLGVTINKDLIVSAVKAITLNLNSLGPLVLPLSEKYLVLKNLFTQRIFRAKIQPYIPKFGSSIHHFFPHVGGKPVLDELQRNLGFSDATMEASRMTLYRFGNTSSSAVWYSMAYAEAKGRVKKGDLLWQIGFGAGFKCSSVVWRAMGDLMKGDDEGNPWSGEIDKYPVNLDSIKPLTEREYFFEPTKK